MQPHVQRRGLCAFSEVNKQGNLGLSLLQCLSPLSQCVWQICFPNKPLATAWQKKKKNLHQRYRWDKQSCLTSHRGGSLLLCFVVCFISITGCPSLSALKGFGAFRKGSLSMAQTWHINKTKKAWILLFCFFFLPSLLRHLLHQ